MRITYVTHTRFPTEKAHGNQVAQVCHALGKLGHQVTLLAPTVRNDIRDDAFTYYGLSRSFTVTYPGSFDALGSRWIPGKLGFMIGMWSYGRSLRAYLQSHAADALYVRSPSLVGSLLRTGMPVFLELHTIPRFFRAAFVRKCNRCYRVVCLTYLMRAALIALGVEPDRILVEPDAVDLERFADQQSTRNVWGLPPDVPVIGYVGSLATQNVIEKGVGDIVAALAQLKSQGQTVCGFIVGGPASLRRRYEEQAQALGLTKDDILFHDRVAPPLVPSVIAAFDICVYPAPASHHPFFQRDTSPLKLFEYLASGKPVVCADIPPLHEVVEPTTVRFCAPGDAASLAQAIQWTLGHPAEAKEMAIQGREIVESHSWTERMRRILEEL